jgi:hypothetical protein
MEKGLSFLPKYSPAEAVFVDTNMHVTITQGIRDRFRSAGGIEINII